MRRLLWVGRFPLIFGMLLVMLFAQATLTEGYPAMPSDIKAVDEADEETDTSEAVEDAGQSEDPAWTEEENEESKINRDEIGPPSDVKYDLNPWNRLRDDTPNPEGNLYIP